MAIKETTFKLKLSNSINERKGFPTCTSSELTVQGLMYCRIVEVVTILMSSGYGTCHFKMLH